MSSGAKSVRGFLRLSAFGVSGLKNPRPKNPFSFLSVIIFAKFVIKNKVARFFRFLFCVDFRHCEQMRLCKK
ncbi:hypothetical protein [Helicobacter sp. T3_23-1056]